LNRAPWIVGGASFALCIFLAAPGTTWHDGGELGLAAATLGVAHPPGEPAYLVLAALAALIPVGDVCFRLTLLSAATVAGSAALMVVLGRRLAAATGASEASSRIAGIAAGTLVAVSPLTVLQGVRPELYGLTLLGGLLGVLGLAIGGRRGVALAVLPLAVIGAVHHAMLVAALPGLAVAALLRGRRAFVAGLATAAAFLLPALGQFAWLPLRSFANTPLDFGAPRTLGRVLWSITGAGYARSFQGMDADLLLRNLRGHLDLFVHGFGLVALLLAGLGVACLAARRSARPVLGAGLLVGVSGIAPTALQGLFVTDNPDAAGYLLGVVAVVAAAACVGIAVVIDRARPAAGTLTVTVLGVGLVASAALQPAAATLRDVDFSRLDGPSRLGNAVLDVAPSGSLVLLGGDSWAFPALFARYREGRRADVHVHPLHMLDPEAIVPLAERGVVPREIDARVLQAAGAVRSGGCCVPETLVAGIVAAGTPVLVNDTFLPPSLSSGLRPHGLLYRIEPGAPAGLSPAEVDAAAKAEDRLEANLLRRLPVGGHRDVVLEGVIGRRYSARAGFFRSRGEGALALATLRRGSAAAADPWAMVHLDRHRMEEGRAPVAPADGSGRLPLGPWLEAADVEAGLTEWIEGAGGAGGVADLLALRGTIRLVTDDPSGAREDVEAVLSTHPSHPSALLAAERLRTLGVLVDVSPGTPP